jgi:hypothetical protein
MFGLLGMAADVSLLLLGAVVFLLLLAASEIGYQVALRVRRGEAGETERTSVGFISGGMLALMAFLIAISLSIADRRHEERRSVLLAEANAIGTAWLRAGGLDSEAGGELQRLIAQYAEIRLQAVTGVEGPSEAHEDILARSAALQGDIWVIGTEIARQAPTAVSALLLGSLNDVFDLAVSQRRAVESQIPAHVLRLLLWTSLLAVGALGFHLGVLGSRQFGMSTMLILMWTGAMILIVDIDRAQQGFVEVSPDPLIWTVEGIRPSVIDPGS